MPILQSFPGIETPRMRLLACYPEILESVLAGDDVLARYLGIVIPSGWTEFGTPAFEYSYKKILESNDQPGWWTYLPVLLNSRTLVGSCGFKGSPLDGKVEIGYEVAKTYRGQGLATEMARGLVEYAWKHPDVRIVQANTLAEINQSGSVLLKCGFEKTEELEDPEDGLIWRWEIMRKKNL